MITVCIVEDLEDIRNGLAAIINMTDGFKVLQTFSNAEDALQQLSLLQPDIVVMDINLPGISGIECIRRVHEKNRSIQFMMFTIYENSDTVFEALESGATWKILQERRGKVSEIGDMISKMYEELYGRERTRHFDPYKE